jgi:predicted ABC-type ATPase
MCLPGCSRGRGARTKRTTFHASRAGWLALSSVDVALARVTQRVLQGGHNIPEEVVRRRFLAGRANFDELYRNLVDAWVLYDNSDAVPVLLDWGEKR